MKGEAAVADAVRMAAFEAGAVTAEQQPARHQSRSTLPRTILKRAGRHRGDRDGAVLFLERTVLRAVGADHVMHPPAVACGEDVCRNAHGLNLR